MTAGDGSSGTATIDCGADGMPNDPALRRVALAILRELDKPRRVFNDLVTAGGRALHRKMTRKEFNAFDERPEEILDEEDLRWKVATDRARQVVLALHASGRIHAEDTPGNKARLLPAKGRLDPATPEARRANFAAVVEGIAARVGSSPEIRARVARLYRMIGAVDMYHRIPFGDGRAVVVPTALAFDASGVRPTAMLVIAVTRTGVTFRVVGDDGIRCRFVSDDEVVIEIDPKACMDGSADIERNLRIMVINPGVNDGMGKKIDDLRTAGLSESWAKARPGVEAFLGTKLEGRAWNSLRMSALRRGPRRVQLVRGLIASVMDPEIRRAVLRNAWGRIEDYEWFCHPDDEIRKRRLQASSVFPALTSMLINNFQHVIDEGLPLTSAIAERFDISQDAVRHMIGVTWQRVGNPHVSQYSDAELLMRMISHLVPEDRPRTRRDWNEIYQLSMVMDRTFGTHWPKNIRRLETVRRLSQIHLGDALRDFGALITALRNRTIDQNLNLVHQNRLEVNALIATTIMGAGGSAKRLVAFANDWHRGQVRRWAAFSALRRRLSNGKDSGQGIWAPLTPEPFMFEGGTLTWLCTEDELADEGQIMNHCVGSYGRECLSGGCHIASVVSADGERSTIELEVIKVSEPSRKKPPRYEFVLRQNYGRMNGPPAAACERIVDEFLRRARGEPEFVDVAKARRELKRIKAARKNAIASERKASVDDGMFDPDGGLSEKAMAMILALYDDCLPTNARLTREGWLEIVGMAMEPLRLPVAVPDAEDDEDDDEQGWPIHAMAAYDD